MDDFDDFTGFLQPIDIVLEGSIIREKYVGEVPGDLYEDPQDRWDYAVYYAREMIETYVMPCDWVLESDDGEHVTLWREYRKTEVL